MHWGDLSDVLAYLPQRRPTPLILIQFEAFGDHPIQRAALCRPPTVAVQLRNAQCRMHAIEFFPSSDVYDYRKDGT